MVGRPPANRPITVRVTLGDRPLLAAPGAFGENLSVDGLDEQSVCLGDEWQIGSARFAVSQGRQPCWKLNDRLLITRPHPDWPLDRVATLIRQRVCEPATLHAVLALPLPPSWRKLFERRLEQGAAEDWAPRLHGPARQ